MKMDIILSKWCLAILFAFGILACTDGGDANELPKDCLLYTSRCV